MFDETAARLIEMRSGYDYPREYMQYASGPTTFKLTPDVFAEPVHPARDEITDMALDECHARLLNSNEALDNLLGRQSTVLCDFYTFSAGYAVVRVQRYVEGYADGSPMTAVSF
ncbi:hypothetical protein [Burkholderia ambifaria]|uniref:hypothetical protein n=1 Tax=Burkholderia ambifaria TaxID=152480 RepID=UPI001B95B987|nr:hypothetical protein [Burkholderia ambifaria]MBR8175783.1 hypothetical protein [Burkholderia ambifaria]